MACRVVRISLYGDWCCRFRSAATPVRPRKQFDGQVALAYFILYSLARFGLEFFRTDSLMIGDFKAAQLTALVTALAAAGLWLWQKSKARSQPAPVQSNTKKKMRK